MMSQSISSYTLLQCIVSAAEFVGGELTFYSSYAELIAADAHGQTTSPLVLDYDGIRHFRVVRAEQLLRISVSRAVIQRWAGDNGFDSQLDNSDEDENVHDMHEGRAAGDKTEEQDRKLSTLDECCLGDAHAATQTHQPCSARMAHTNTHHTHTVAHEQSASVRTSVAEALCVILCQLSRAEFAHFLDAVAPTVAATRRHRSASRISVTNPLRLRCHIADPAVGCASHSAPTEQERYKEQQRHQQQQQQQQQQQARMEEQQQQQENETEQQGVTDDKGPSDMTAKGQTNTRDVLERSAGVTHTNALEQTDTSHPTRCTIDAAADAAATDRCGSHNSLPAVWRISANTATRKTAHSACGANANSSSDLNTDTLDQNDALGTAPDNVSTTTSERVCDQLTALTTLTDGTTNHALRGGAPLPRSRPHDCSRHTHPTQPSHDSHLCNDGVTDDEKNRERRSDDTRCMEEKDCVATVTAEQPMSCSSPSSPPTAPAATCGKTTRKRARTASRTGDIARVHSGSKRRARKPRDEQSKNASCKTTGKSDAVARPRANRGDRRRQRDVSVARSWPTPCSAFAATLLGDLCTLLPASRSSRGQGRHSAWPKSRLTARAAATAAATIITCAPNDRGKDKCTPDVAGEHEQEASKQDEHDRDEVMLMQVDDATARATCVLVSDGDEDTLTKERADCALGTHAQTDVVHTKSSAALASVLPDSATGAAHATSSTTHGAGCDEAASAPGKVATGEMHAMGMCYWGNGETDKSSSQVAIEDRGCSTAHAAASATPPPARRQGYPFPLLMVHEDDECQRDVEENGAAYEPTVAAADTERRAMPSCPYMSPPSLSVSAASQVREEDGAQPVRIASAMCSKTPPPAAPLCPDSYPDNHKHRIRRLMRQLNVVAHSLAVLKECHEELRTTLISMIDDGDVR